MELGGWATHANQGGVNGRLSNQLKTLDAGLSPKDLYQGRDLKPTTDMRGVIKGVLGQHLSIKTKQLDTIFPDSEMIKPLDII